MTHTPTTQQVREAYEVAHESCGLPPSGNEFDIWLEIHDAEVSARALRNAAKELEARAEGIREGLGSLLHGAGGDPGRRHDQDRIRELGRQADWLQARADNIAQGEKP